MPTTDKKKRTNVGKARNAKNIVLTKVEDIHYRAFKSNTITSISAMSSCPRLKDYIKQD